MAAIAAPPEQRTAGSPELVRYCPKCKCTVVPLENGKCGWCSTPIMPAAGKSAAARRKAVARPRPARGKPKPTAPPPLMDELADVNERVASQIGELAQALVSDGRTYAAAYARWWIGGENGKRPVPPPALVGDAARLIRDRVVDEAAAVRLAGRRRAA